MADLSNPRVAVYIDFDNIVVSRYNQLYGRAAWTNDSARNFAMAGGTTGAGGRGAAAAAEGIPAKLEQARVDIGAILDYASSFGSIVVNRAYADWSAPANSSYSRQLIDRAVDLTQLFNTAGIEERRRHPAGGGCGGRPLPARGHHACGDRGRRLRLHRTRAAVPSVSAASWSGSGWPAPHPEPLSPRATSSPTTTRCRAW